MVHLLSYLPEMRGNTQMIEEPITLNNIKISLRNDSYKIKRVYMAPSKETLQYKIKKDYIELIIHQVKGEALVVFEYN
jgi:hypothetical protein